MAFWNRTKRDEYLSEARRAKKRGEFDRAGDNFYLAGEVDEAIEMYVHGKHHKLAAKLYEKEGKRRKAAEHFALAKDYRAAAAIYERIGDTKRASQLYERLGEKFKAAQLEAELGQHQRAADLYTQSGHRELAAAAYAKAGEHATAAKLLDEHLSQGGVSHQKEKAEVQWGQCAELYRRARNHTKAAEIWQRIGLHQKAASAFAESGDHSNAVELFLKAGDPERAWMIYESAPDGSITTRAVAELSYAREDWPKAAGLFRDLGHHERAAKCFDKAGDTMAGAEQYELAGELELAANLFYAAGEFVRASKLYEGALRTVNAAGAAQKAGDNPRAAGLYEVAQMPVEAAACWQECGEVDKAIKLLQQVPVHHDGYAKATLQLAEAFRGKGLTSIAREKYESAIAGRQVDMETIGAYYGLARLCEDEGQRDEARKIHERIVATDYNYLDSSTRLQGLSQPTQANLTPHAPMPAVGEPTGQVTRDTMIMAGESGPSSSGSSNTGVLGGRYEVVSRMGEGDGEVYKAWDSSLGRTVVLKRLVSHAPEDDGQLRRYVNEARTASKLHHSNIATIYDAVDSAEGRLVAMEYVFGRSLREMLDTDQRLAPGFSIEVIAQVLLALEYAHAAGVTHRNLRPENVLVAEKHQVKLTDFGMNRRYADLASAPVTEHSPIYYLSPEQIRGDKIDGRADIYAVGCILYEMLTGRPPFTGAGAAEAQLNQAPPAPSQVDPDIPEEIDVVVLRCLAKDPRERYGSARQMHEALRAFDFVPGQRIGDRYELVREIGTGGMGKVYLARDLQLEETIAIKVLRPEFGTDAGLEQRFIREIKMARKVVHPSVVKVYDFGKIDDTKFITMEYIEGISLEDYVKRSVEPNVAEVGNIAIQICEALGAAHRLGVVHRDIKPQNVLISSEGRVKLVDFGIARIEENEDITSSRHIIGSPKYMSPEQITGKNVDLRTDIYAFGCVAYYCFTGLEAFSAPDTNAIIMKQLRDQPVPPIQVNPALPPWVEMLIMRCLVKDVAGRYQSTDEIVADLRANLGSPS